MKKIISISSVLVLTFGILASGVSQAFAITTPDGAVLGVTQISAIQTYATADGQYADGWQWVFDVTVPNNEPIVSMKFADWTNGSNIISAANNIQFYSPQSTNASSSASAISINASGTYSGEMDLNTASDLNVAQAGRQIQITVEARVPAGSAGGSYSTSYGIESLHDTTPPVITLLGTSPVAVTQGSTYTDAGATALDQVDGDITPLIVLTGTVDTSVVGTSTLNYNVTDSDGLAANQVTRTVDVVSPVAITGITLNGTGLVNGIAATGSGAVWTITVPQDTATTIDSANYTMTSATVAMTGAATSTSYPVTFSSGPYVSSGTSYGTLAYSDNAWTLTPSPAQTFETPGTWVLAATVKDDAGTQTVVNITLTVTTPASITLTVPSAATIIQSTALIPETSGKANDNSAVAAVVTAGLAPIPVTLANTGGTASAANVLIAPIGASSNVQLWAQDTSGNWYDINVTGWGPAGGFPVPAGYNATTNVYPISNVAGSYPLIAKLVNAATPSTVVASGSGTLTVVPAVSTYKITTAPATASIIASTLLSETTQGEASDNATVSSTLDSVTPISVTLATDELGAAGYDAVRINPPSGTDANLQLWAQDTSGNWWDIAKAGWGSPSGFPLSAQFSATTEVYPVAAAANTYNLTYSVATVTGGTLVATGTGTLTVNTPTLSSIAITTPATTTAYIGGTLDLTGLVVTGTYSDGSTQVEPITASNVSGFDSTAATSSETLTITYGGKTTTYDVSVVAQTVISVDNLQPSWTADGGGGVWSSYQGPNNDYAYISPGVTAVYNGREAAPIYAGVTIDPTDHIYEDQGLLAFMPGNVPVVTFATQPLTYDVENATGQNPVWVRIRLTDTNQTEYQFVPTTNPASWHTVDAATGEWQLMDDNGNATGTPMTLAAVAAANPGLEVDRVYLTLGMGDSYNVSLGVGTVAWVDTVTVGGTTYDFVTAPVAISSVASLGNITIGEGIASPSLPSTVGVTLSNGSTSTLPVVWSTASTPTYNDEATGTYTFTGTLTLPAGVINPSSQTATVNVVVVAVGPTPGLSHVTSVASSSDITIGEGIASPSLPSTVGVTLSNGSTPSYSVTWNGGSPAYDDATPGTYVFTGTLTTPLGVSANGETASVNVIVAANVTTIAATDVTSADATLNGLNGPADAGQTSFWVSLASFDTSTSNIPAGVYSTPVLNNIPANGTFSDPLSLVTTEGITTGGVSANLPAVTPSTTYYFVAWSNVGGTWYHGAIMNFTTASLSHDDTLSVLTPSAGTLSPAFASGTISYADVLPYGTTVIPTVTATLNDLNATDTITQATSTTGSATVKVTAADGSTNQTYTVNFSVGSATVLAVGIVLPVPTVSVVDGTTLVDVGLPTSVPVALSNGSTQMLPVTWDGSSYNPTTPGTYTFTGTLTLPAGVINPNNKTATVKVVVTPVATATTISTLAINGVTAPVTTATPVATIADNGQYTGTVTWAPTDNPFIASTTYAATITLTPDSGYTLTGVAANSFTVTGATTTNAADSGVVTAVFPTTN